VRFKKLIVCSHAILFYLFLVACRRNNPNTRILNLPIEFFSKSCGENLEFYSQEACQKIIVENKLIQKNVFNSVQPLNHSVFLFQFSRMIPEYYPLFLNIYQRIWAVQKNTEEWKFLLNQWPPREKLELSGDKFLWKRFLPLHTQAFLENSCQLPSKIMAQGEEHQLLLSLFFNSKTANSYGDFRFLSSSKLSAYNFIANSKSEFDQIKIFPNLQNDEYLKKPNDELFSKLKPWDMWWIGNGNCQDNFSPLSFFVNVEKGFFMQEVFSGVNSAGIRVSQKDEIFSKANLAKLFPSNKNSNFCVKVFRLRSSSVLKTEEEIMQKSEGFNHSILKLSEKGFENCKPFTYEETPQK
jgi:hypothetical protein